MIFKIIICLIVVCASVLFAHTIEKIKEKEKNKMSFMEAFNLTELTIVTLLNGNVKLNFLLDTGSNNSFISKSTSKIAGLLYKESSEKCYVTCAAGNGEVDELYTIPLTYKDNTYSADLYVMESLDNSFDVMKREYGVQVHGILGTKFMNENNFVLDFEELVAYKK